MKFFKKCPTCGKEIFYKGEPSFKISVSKNSDCKSCSILKRGTRDKNTKIKIGNTLKNLYSSPEWKQKLSLLRSGEHNGMFGKRHTDASKRKMSKKIKLAMNSDLVKEKMNKIRKSIEYKELRSEIFKGKLRSAEHCRALRLAHIKRIETMIGNGLPLNPRFNTKACKIIDEYGKQNGYNFRHAMNGGEYYIKELGYWVDGYDKEKNIILEIDEPHHFDIYGNLREKDVRRQKEIVEYLNCKFLRISLKEKI